MKEYIEVLNSQIRQGNSFNAHGDSEEVIEASGLSGEKIEVVNESTSFRKYPERDMPEIKTSTHKKTISSRNETEINLNSRR